MSERPDYTRLLKQSNRFLNSLTAGDTDRPQVATFRWLLFLLARLSFATLVLMTSFYCILAYIPFTYNWVIQCTLVAWLPVFVKLHPFLYCAVLGLVIITIVPDLLQKETRRISLWFIVYNAAFGLLLLFRPLLAGVTNDYRSFLWGLITLFPLLWIAAIDYAGQWKKVEWTNTNGRARPTFTAAALAGLSLSLLYGGIFLLRFSGNAAGEFTRPELLFAFGWSVGAHLFFFTCLFLALRLIRAVSDKFAAAAQIEFILCNLLANLLAALVFRRLIFSALSFGDSLADLYSITVALCSVGFAGGLGLRLWRIDRSKASSGLELTLLPMLALLPGKNSSRFAQVLGVVTLAAIAYLVPAGIAQTDWDFLIQKLSVVAVWTAGFIFFYSLTARPVARPRPAALVLLIAAVSIGGYRVCDLLRPHLSGDKFNVNAALDRYADYEISFKVLQDVLHPNINLSFSSSGAVQSDDNRPGSDDESFYAFLRQNTHLPESVRVNPVDVRIVDKLARARGKKPHIFVFVLDSLRQDYFSPYNPQVSFTPSIESFARESIVMENAFAQYGGTAFSEPTIWVGAMQLHKQYIQPFYPMNALQKLVEAEGYESFITMDPVLEKIVKPSPEIVELNKGLDWSEYHFCNTMEEIKAKLDARQPAGRPIFLYTQQQDLHIIMRNHRLRTEPPTEEFPGFDAYYASKIKRIDSCLGEFVKYLKARGLYDDSIIILTSDHGDSLGEGGRWGHAHHLFPEVIRIPIIIHLPPALQKELVWDAKGLTFPTDITPSLYYLLGHRPIAREPIFGRPLFTATHEERLRYMKDSYLLGASYGVTYGVLSDNGRALFITDAINRRQYFYNLADDPKRMRNLVTDEIRARYHGVIRHHIQAINRFYRFDGGNP